MTRIMVRKWQKFFLIVFVITLGVGCDQTTKRVAEQTLKGAPMRSMLNDTVRLQYVQNTGAFLGFGSRFSKQVKFWCFTALPILTLLSMLLFAFFSRRMTRVQIVLLMLIVSGGIGNLLDRVFLNGKVTDFLNMGIGSIRTGIFNIADVAIMVGTFGLIAYSFLLPDEDEMAPALPDAPLPAQPTPGPSLDATGLAIQRAVMELESKPSLLTAQPEPQADAQPAQPTQPAQSSQDD